MSAAAPLRSQVPKSQTTGASDPSAGYEGEDVPPVAFRPSLRSLPGSVSAPALDIAALYQRFGPMVLRRIRRFYSGDEAQDVLQEIFMRVLDKQSSFRGESSPGTWLYAMTTRYCLNRLRDERRRRELLAEHDNAACWSSAVAKERQEQEVLVRQLWRDLDEELSLIGIYYYLDGMSHAEIASLVGCSRRTVGNRLAELGALLQSRAEEA
jgi:RNA polymerase sigma-70 factor (ECF subfamily)